MQLQMQQQKNQMDGQLRMQDLQMKQAQMTQAARENDQEMQIKWQQLETERIETAAMLQEQEMRYSAELQRLSGDMQMKHADNLIKILTHQPKESNPPQPRERQ